MAWVGAMARDAELPPVQLKVAAAVGTYFNNKSGVSYQSQQTIAKDTGLGIATVRRALQSLEERGYLLIQRHDLGTKTRKKRDGGTHDFRAAGGVPNVYAPAISSVRLDESSGRDLFGKDRPCPNDPDHQRSPSCADRDQNDPSTVITGDHLTYAYPSDKNLTRGRAREAGIGSQFPEVESRLRKRLGNGIYGDWFSRLTPIEGEATVVKLATTSRIVAKKLTDWYLPEMLDCWRRVHPQVERIEIVLAQNCAGNTQGRGP